MDMTSLLGNGANWISEEHQRRQLAYRILSAYVNNNDGWVLDDADPDHRSYGDARMITDRYVAGILSRQFDIRVVGAQKPEPYEPPDAPDAVADDAPEALRDLNAYLVDEYEREVEAGSQRWIDSWEQYKAASTRNEWLKSWMNDEKIHMKVVEAESDHIVPLGDGVFVMGWDAAHQRPSVAVYSPEFYFPVIEAATDSEPTKIHLAWEEPNEQGESQYLRRITYELRDIEAPVIDGQQVLVEGDVSVENEDGSVEIRRRLPWHSENEYTTQTCYFSDWRWNIGAAGNWNQLDPRRADRFATDVDLLYDFIPVVHVPNTPSTLEHYGRSSLISVAQLLDDVGSFDLQHAESSAIAAVPIVAVEGMSAKTVMDMKAGTILPVPNGGKVSVVSTADALGPLDDYRAALDDRLMRNAGLGPTTGTAGNSQASGLRVKLERGPFEEAVEVMRLTRSARYALLADLAQKIALTRDGLDDGYSRAMPAEVVFGPATPSDVSDVVASVTALVTNKVMSRRTALEHLAQVLPARDFERELRMIAAEDHGGAKDIADATNSDQAAADYLGVELQGPTANVPNVTFELP